MVVRSGGVYFLVQVALLGRNVQYYFYVETQERSGSVQYHMHIRIELPRLYVNDTIGAEAFPLDQQQALGGDQHCGGRIVDIGRGSISPYAQDV